ncbi:MAG: hypothetical protein QXJ59_00400 [Thermofilaceae archaeon]
MPEAKIVAKVSESENNIRFYRKSGRLTFVGRDRMYLDLKRIRKAFLIVPKDPLHPLVRSYLVLYETENVEYYEQRSMIPYKELEKAVERGEIELKEVDSFYVITEWDADEPVREYRVSLSGRVEKTYDAIEESHRFDYPF